ncbi:MAG: hypothetical protein QOJ51_6773 [Acidobacteriaceae bacterium]|nr:hypothetical protein [Acidobacteriaceae bacterium]
MLPAAEGLEAFANNDYGGNAKLLHNQGKWRWVNPLLRRPSPALFAPRLGPSDLQSVQCRKQRLIGRLFSHLILRITQNRRGCTKLEPDPLNLIPES